MRHVIADLERCVPNSLYLAFFRLFICFHLLKKVIIFSTAGEILYGNNSFISHQNSFLFGSNTIFLRDHYQILTIIYILFICLYFFGIGKNIVAFIVYLIFLIFQQLNGMWGNGGDNLLNFILLYLVFANSYDYFSVGETKAYSIGHKRISNLLTNLACYSIMLHLCFVYFFSAIGKINTNEWYRGVALYYTLISDKFNGTRFNEPLANNGYFITLGTYFTLIFELLFPFLIWNKSFRIWLIISGILLHLSIYIFMMIHDFELLFIAIYGFFYSNKELLTFRKRFRQVKAVNFILFKKHRKTKLPN